MQGVSHVSNAIKTLLQKAGEQGVTATEAYHHVSAVLNMGGCNKQQVQKRLIDLTTKAAKATGKTFAEKVPGTDPRRYRIRLEVQKTLVTAPVVITPTRPTMFWANRAAAFALKRACVR